MVLSKGRIDLIGVSSQNQSAAGPTHSIALPVELAYELLEQIIPSLARSFDADDGGGLAADEVAIAEDGEEGLRSLGLRWKCGLGHEPGATCHADIGICQGAGQNCNWHCRKVEPNPPQARETGACKERATLGKG